MGQDNARMEALELKMMDLENSLAELNDVIISQYQEIDALKIRQQQLQNRVDAGGESSAAIDAGVEPPPPHY